MSKPRVESKWFHESESFGIVAVDAISTDDIYIKAALFCLKPSQPKTFSKDDTPHNKRKPRRMSFLGLNEDLEIDENDTMEPLNYSNHDIYSVDIGTNQTPRLQLEVLFSQYILSSLHLFL